MIAFFKNNNNKKRIIGLFDFNHVPIQVYVVSKPDHRNKFKMSPSHSEAWPSTVNLYSQNFQTGI